MRCGQQNADTLSFTLFSWRVFRSNRGASFVVEGIQGIVVERDRANAAAAQLPPVMPHELVTMSARSFSATLTLQKPRLLHFFSEHDFNEIDKQFRALSIHYREDNLFRVVILGHALAPTIDCFEKFWSDVGDGFDLLRDYCGCGGIACVMAGTASVESDFSLIIWTKDPHSASMTDFTLGWILHCKQHDKLTKLCGAI